MKDLRVKSWSYSTLKTYKTCPFKIRMKLVGVREPSSPAMERGTNIHGMAEDYLKGKRKDIAPELVSFKDDLVKLRKKGAQAEEEWGFTVDWKPCSWDDPACIIRMKLDARVEESKTSMLIIDWKTGKRYPDHSGQCSFYAMGAFINFPYLKEVTVRMCYLDAGGVMEENYTIDELPDMIEWWMREARAMLNDTEFAPRPGNYCRWCFFSAAKGGQCEF